MPDTIYCRSDGAALLSMTRAVPFREEALPSGAPDPTKVRRGGGDAALTDPIRRRPVYLSYGSATTTPVRHR